MSGKDDILQAIKAIAKDISEMKNDISELKEMLRVYLE